MNARRLLVLLCVAGLVTAGCTRVSPPPAPPEEKVLPRPVKDPAPPDVTDTPPKFTLTADELAREYQKDRAAADKKYDGAVIEVSGEVSMVGTNLAGDALVFLNDRLTCATVDKEPWASVSKGQKVTIKGAWLQSRGSASLEGCVIVEKGPNPATVLTAEQLAAEYAAGRQAAINKYKEKYLIVTGEVVTKDENRAGAPVLRLKGTDKVSVDCGFTADDEAKKAVEPLAAGHKVKVIGLFLAVEHTDKSVALRLCHRITR
jgi:hypothetical protein